MISIKKRRPLLVEGSLRVTFTKDDILIEDFIEQNDTALYIISEDFK